MLDSELLEHLLNKFQLTFQELEEMIIACQSGSSSGGVGIIGNKEQWLRSRSINCEQGILNGCSIDIFEEDSIFIPKRLGLHKVILVGAGQGGYRGQSGVGGPGGGSGDLEIFFFNAETLDPIAITIGKGGRGSGPSSFQHPNTTLAAGGLANPEPGGDTSFGQFVIAKGATVPRSLSGIPGRGASLFPGGGVGGYDPWTGVYGGDGGWVERIASTSPVSLAYPPTRNGGSPGTGNQISGGNNVNMSHIREYDAMNGNGYGAGGGGGASISGTNGLIGGQGRTGSDGVVVVCH